MITIKNGSLFDAAEGIICHQVNCKGNMGRGVAKQFRNLFPIAFQKYDQKCFCGDYAPTLLGEILIHQETEWPRLYTCSMFAQYDWRGHNVCNTDYPSFRECCFHIKKFAQERNLTIHMPYKIGCGLGGGEWEIVYSIIEEELNDCNVILWKLDN